MMINFWIPVGYGYLTVFLFSVPLESIYNSRTFTPRQNHAGMNMVKNDVDPNNDLGFKIFSHLEIPTKYQYLIG